MSATIEPATAPELRSAFYATLRDVEWRRSGNGKDFTFTGSAVVYDSWSERLWTPFGSFRERIMPGAFDDVLSRSPDVRLLFNHDGLPLARTKSGTLELTSEPDALRVWARVSSAQQISNDLMIAMERGDVDQMSFAFGFDVNDGAEERWYEDEETGESLRDVVKVSDLYDVSAVTYPAYEATSAAMRTRNADAVARIRSAAQADPAGTVSNTAGTINTTVFLSGQEIARAVADATTEAAPAETDPADDVVSPLAALRSRASDVAQRERESYLRLLKELTRETHHTGRGGS